jgi:mRNA interferase HicA
VTSRELYRWLAERGCKFQPAKGGHLKVFLGARQTVIPMHGTKHDLNKGLVAAIKKQLGLK